MAHRARRPRAAVRARRGSSKLPLDQGLFLGLNEALLALERATQAGTTFVFGYLGGAPVPFAETAPGRPSCWPSARCR